MADNQKKENFFKRAVKGTASHAKATKSELKKVSWPTRKQLINNTAIVIVCIAVVGVFITLIDLLFGSGFKFFVTREPKAPEMEVASEVATRVLNENETGTELYEDVSGATEATNATE